MTNARSIVALIGVACLLVLLVAPGLPAAAQDAAAGAEPARLRVGAPERPPYAMQAIDGSWQGIAIDLWRMIAEEHDLAYDFVRVPRGRMLAAIEGGRLDVALAVDATPRSEAAAELTPAFYVSTLTVASRREVIWWHVLSNVLSIEFLQVMGSLSVLLLVVGALVWLVERRANAAQFHKRPLLGLGDGFWWAGVTLTTIGYGDKTPKSLAGRAIAMVWMVIGLAVSAALTASVVSATNIEGATGLRIPTDLVDRRVGAVAGSSAAGYLYGQSIAVEEFASLTEAFAALAERRVDAVADGYAAIRFGTASASSSLVISTSPRDPQYVTMAVRKPETPREVGRLEILRASVLGHITSDGWWRLVTRYLPPLEQNPGL